jgi:hypothetical protein
VTNLQESEVAEQFLEQRDEDSFDALFHVFSPQLVAFFRKRGHEKTVAEDLAQDVMLTVYRKAGSSGITNFFEPGSSRWRATPRAGTSPSARGRCRQWM